MCSLWLLRSKTNVAFRLAKQWQDQQKEGCQKFHQNCLTDWQYCSAFRCKDVTCFTWLCKWTGWSLFKMLQEHAVSVPNLFGPFLYPVLYLFLHLILHSFLYLLLYLVTLIFYPFLLRCLHLFLYPCLPILSYFDVFLYQVFSLFWFSTLHPILYHLNL